MIGIYKVTNKVNNKCYIGQSINIAERWKVHKRGPFNPNSTAYDSLFYKAIRKYGLQNFTFEIIEECKKEELNEKEIKYISQFRSNEKDYGYNLTPGGQLSSPICIKLADNDIKEICYLLANTKMSEQEIANKFNVSQRLVSGINIGQYRLQEGQKYPIRDFNIIEKEKIYCKRCGKEITRYSKTNLCVSCFHVESRKIEHPSREELKNLIRTTPFTRIGEKYGVSDNAIRKWCDAYGLPKKALEIKRMTDEQWSKI